MSESKSFASLGPTLLARKGGARPAMRPQLNVQHLEDLGWNDMGNDDDTDNHSADIVPLTPAPANEKARAEAHANDVAAAEELAQASRPAVLFQQDSIAAKFVEPRRSPSKPRRSALDDGRRAAFTLRLDSERHLKLRLACTIKNRSAQQVVTEALDQLLGQMADLDTLASQVKRK